MTDQAGDTELRLRVSRMLEVLRRAAVARPTRHLRDHPGLFPLVDVSDRVHRPSAAHGEVLRVARYERPGADQDGAIRGPFEVLEGLVRLAADASGSVELVLAAGLLHVPDDGVHVHLLTQPVRVDREPDTDTLVCTVDPRSGPRLEDDAVLVGTSLLTGEAAAARERVLEKLDSALDTDLVAVLGEWAGAALAREVAVGDAWLPPEGDDPQLVPAPMILARRVGTQGLLEHHDRLLAGVADPAVPVPLRLARLVEPGDGDRPPARIDDDAVERDVLLDELVAARDAEAEVHRVVAPGFAGTAAAIAREVERTRGEDGWLAPLLDPAVALPPTLPVTAAEVTELRRLLAMEIVDPGRGRRRDQVLPPPAELPPESHVAELVAAVGARGPASALVAALCALPQDAAEHLTPACRRTTDARAELEGAGEDQGWALGVVDAVLAGRATHAWSRAVAGLGGVDAIVEHDRLAGPVQVRVAEGLDVRAAAEAFERFAEHLDGGGAVRRVFKSEEQKAAETALAGLEVRGVDTTTPSGVRAVAHHLRILEITDALAAGFAPLGHRVRCSEHRGVLVEQALALRATCRRIGALLTAAGQVRAVLGALPAAGRPRLDGLPALRAVCSVALEVAGSRAADSARRELVDIVERVQDGTPVARHAPELRAVVDALRRLDVVGYVDAVEAVDRARVEQRGVRRADVLTARLAESMPGLLAALRADPSEGAWSDREARWTAALAHARAAAWLAAQAEVDAPRGPRAAGIADVVGSAGSAGSADVEGSAVVAEAPGSAEVVVRSDVAERSVVPKSPKSPEAPAAERVPGTAVATDVPAAPAPT